MEPRPLTTTSPEQSTTWAGSDQTTPRSSPSRPEGAGTQRPSTSSPTADGRSRHGDQSRHPSPPPIRWADRTLILGRTGTGKSQLARALILTAPADGQRIIIDPNDSTATDIPGAVTFTDPAKRTNRRGEDWHAAAWARFVPTDPTDLEAYGRVYERAFADPLAPRLVWCDEAGDVLPAHGAPKHGLRYLRQGRKRQKGHFACHTRPRAMSVDLLGQADHLVLFAMPSPADVEHVAKTVGLETRQLLELFRTLPEHGFLLHSQRAPGYVFRCPGLTWQAPRI